MYHSKKTTYKLGYFFPMIWVILLVMLEAGNGCRPKSVPPPPPPPIDTTAYIPGPPTWQDVVSGNIKSLTGSMVYYVPDSMVVGQFYEASMVLGSKEETAELIQTIKKDIKEAIDTSEITSVSVQIGKRMKAILKDPFGAPGENFQISCEPSEEQEVDLSFANQVQWLWNIKPITSGTHRLTMNLWIIVEKDGQTTDHKINVYNGDIDVLSTNEPTSISPEPPDYEMIIGLLGIFLLIGWLVYRSRKKVPGLTKVRPVISAEEFRQLEDNVAEDELELAFDFLRDKTAPVTDGSKKKVLALYSRLNNIDDQRDGNLVSADNYSIGRARIVDALLDLIGDLKKG